MSHDLSVHGARTLAPGRLTDLIAGVPGLRLDPSGPWILRSVRGRYEHLASLDGPMRVEPEDLPDAVRAAAPGITTLWELHCSHTPTVGVRLTTQVARAIAGAANGVVYDPQVGSVTWPRGSARKFRAPKERRIEVVDLTWHIRREDRPDDLPEVVFDTIATLLPEALPRRFGCFEPLAFRLEEEGRSGFVREWRAESSLLFWKTTKPCLSGSMSGLGAVAPHPPAQPVGTVELSLHREALSDERWRRDVVRLFVALTERTRAFFALADVERNVTWAGGHLSYGPEAETPPGLVVRDEWYGLPPHEFWLAWIGPRYRDLVGNAMCAHPDVEEVGGGLLVRAAEEPGCPGDRIPEFPPDLVMSCPAGPTAWARERRRASRVPDGL